VPNLPPEPLIVIALTCIVFGCACAYACIQRRAKSSPKPRVPTLSEFPAGTEFIVKEFDVPLARIPGDGHCIWVNWYGGRPRPFDVTWLKVDNNWSVDSFESWAALVKASFK
jgi:hypothetical protein